MEAQFYENTDKEQIVKIIKIENRSVYYKTVKHTIKYKSMSGLYLNDSFSPIFKLEFNSVDNSDEEQQLIKDFFNDFQLVKFNVLIPLLSSDERYNNVHKQQTKEHITRINDLLMQNTVYYVNSIISKRLNKNTFKNQAEATLCDLIRTYNYYLNRYYEYLHETGLYARSLKQNYKAKVKENKIKTRKFLNENLNVDLDYIIRLIESCKDEATPYYAYRFQQNKKKIVSKIITNKYILYTTYKK